MAARIRSKKLLIPGLFFLAFIGCRHRQANLAAAQPAKPIAMQPQLLMVVPRAIQTFHTTPPSIQFDYPACWHQCPCKTGVFEIDDAAVDSQSCPSICLDIPKLPWHIPGMIPISLVASGYVDDLRKNQIPDAVVQEQVSLKVGDAPARRVTCVGHMNGKPAVDVAVIMIHSDHVYILSADSDDAARAVTRQTLDNAVASLKWMK